MEARKTGMVILGAGLVKHHVCNANLMRNGADFSVYVNTVGHRFAAFTAPPDRERAQASEYDGSDAGAQPDEAISWGKIRMDARPVKVYGDASLLFPLLMAQSFVKYAQAQAGASAPAAGAADDRKSA
jgi:deoxyhypusine synthase